jgi:hypothetical protein
LTSDELIRLTTEVRVPIRKLPSQMRKTLDNAVHGQARTATYKKTVHIVGDLVFKGPYQDNEKLLMRGLRYTFAIQLLEEVLKLDERHRASLQWEYLGCLDGDEYYLAAPNIGKRGDIPWKCTNTEIETNVKVAERGWAVKQVADIEGTEAFTYDIKMATLQHLYLRYLLDIGDFGSHNVLVREAPHRGERLIAGIDLEERRGIKQNQSRLQRLFKKGIYSKDRIALYGSDVDNIRTLSSTQLDDGTLGRLQAVGIDLERLKENITSW